MPDLRLSARQARRLWTLDAELCHELLASLVEEGFLRQTADGSFLRRGEGRLKPSTPVPHAAPLA